MRKILKIKADETIPDGAKYLYSNQELDHSRSYTYEEINTSDPVNYIPILGNIFGTNRVMRRTPYVTVHYYEIEIADENY